MLSKLLILCLLGGALAHIGRQDCCSPGDKRKIQEQWGKLWSSKDSGTIKVILGRVIFDKLFAADASSKDLFKRVNVDNMDSAEFKAHTVRVLNGLDTVINLLQDKEAAAEAMAHLGAQHQRRDGVTAGHFKTMAAILLEGLDNLIPSFAGDSWKACLAQVGASISGKLPA